MDKQQQIAHLKSRIGSAEDCLRELSETLAIFHRARTARGLSKIEIEEKNDLIAEYNAQQRLVASLKDQLKALESR